MIYDLHIVFSTHFLTASLEIVALTTLRIYLMIFLVDITNIDKICDEVGQNLNVCAKDLDQFPIQSAQILTAFRLG